MTRRLLISYLSLAVVVLAMLEVPLGFINERGERAQLTAKIERDAVTIASLAQRAIGAAAPTSGLPQIDSIANRYAEDTGARVVITDAKGVSVIDTDPPAPGARSFATRPEFRAALHGDVATGTRHSGTLGYDLLYVAVPIASGGTVHGAARITYPASELNRRVRNYWLALAGIAAIVLAAAALIGLSFARWIRRPLRGLEAAAAAAGAGDLSARAPVPDSPPELRRLALEFNDMVTRVDGLVAVQRDFVADASHELRTPLTALRLRLENLERHVDGDGHRSLAAAAAEVDRLSTLVDELLALARADAGTTPAEPVDLVVAVERRLDVWRPAAAAVELGLRLTARAPVRARAGPDRVAQVIDNLVSNALRHAPGSSIVEITVTRTGHLAELRVTDRGQGMTPEQKARAFDRFWRAGSGSGGSGLGLAISRRLVEIDGGTIELLDAPSGGLEVVVRLPAG